MSWNVIPCTASTETLNRPSISGASEDPIWTWDFPRVAAAANRVRAGRDLTPAQWPGGARVDLGLKEGARGELNLKALGGALPLTWFVNGAPVGEPDSRRQSAWKPDGAGFARVSVIDARGATDSIWVRVE